MQTGFVTFKVKGKSTYKYYDKKGRLKKGNFKVNRVKYKSTKKNGAIYYVNNIVKPICQKPELPTGCEITSWTIMARYAGIKITKMQAAKIMPQSDDPNKGFVGSPYISYGSGLVVYPNGLKKMTIKYLGSYENMTGCSIYRIKKKLRNKHLVMVWVRNLDGFNSHTIVLTGYDRTSFYYIDPWIGTKRKFIYDYFKSIWELNSKRAMSY